MNSESGGPRARSWILRIQKLAVFCEDFAQINPRFTTPIVTHFIIAANVLNLIIFQYPYLLLVRDTSECPST
jgi:hypothetical protein